MSFFHLGPAGFQDASLKPCGIRTSSSRWRASSHDPTGSSVPTVAKIQAAKQIPWHLGRGDRVGVASPTGRSVWLLIAGDDLGLVPRLPSGQAAWLPSRLGVHP